MSKLSLNERAFPSMRRPGQYVLNVRRRGDWEWNSIHIFIWGDLFAARKFVEAVLRDDEWLWDLNEDGTESSDRLVSSSGIVVETNLTAKPGMLRRVMEHEYTLAEEGWDLPHPYDAQAAKWRMRRVWNKVEPQEQRRARGVPRASRNGLVTIQAIAEELGITPRDARGVLRKAKATKPPCGWAWKDEEANTIREMMRKAFGK